MSDDKNRKKQMQSTAKKIRSNTKRSKERGFRVVITGKGGVGKTTLTAILSNLFVQNGFTTLAVDEDPQMNLPYAIGIPRGESDKIMPLAHNFDYVEEKTNARPGEGWGLMLTLNPDVTDVMDRFCVKSSEGVNILVMGTVMQAATGCLCPENALLESVIRHINLREGEVILMDTQAGVEHFGRAIAQGFSQALLVTDSTFNAVSVVKHAANLAKDLGIPYIHLVINRVRSERDVAKVHEILGDTLSLFSEQFIIPYEEELLEYEPDVTPMLSAKPPSEFVSAVGKLQEVLADYSTKEEIKTPAPVY